MRLTVIREENADEFVFYFPVSYFRLFVKDLKKNIIGLLSCQEIFED